MMCDCEAKKGKHGKTERRNEPGKKCKRCLNEYLKKDEIFNGNK